MNETNTCDMCNGLGYLIVDESNSILKSYQKQHIEKCDSCNLFNTDHQAEKQAKEQE